MYEAQGFTVLDAQQQAGRITVYSTKRRFYSLPQKLKHDEVFVFLIRTLDFINHCDNSTTEGWVNFL